MQNTNIFESLKQSLEERNKSLKENLIIKHKDAFDWLHTTKQLAAGAMGSVLLLTAPGAHFLPQPAQVVHEQKFMDVPDNIFLVTDLKPHVPDAIGELTVDQEANVSEILSRAYGMNVKPEINGLRLNTTYGYIGLEQHLMRYPGDTIGNHFSTSEEAYEFAKNGMAPGRGAFGYFTDSHQASDQKAIDREKYYIAVQTFMAKDYMGRLREYRDFFAFRKMLVVNPNTGKAVVVVIGDAGPAVWTKKHLGGSPEVMAHLERFDGRQKGAVLYFFIDDPEDKIPLGPIEPIEST